MFLKGLKEKEKFNLKINVKRGSQKMESKDKVTLKTQELKIEYFRK